MPKTRSKGKAVKQRSDSGNSTLEQFHFKTEPLKRKVAEITDQGEQSTPAGAEVSSMNKRQQFQIQNSWVGDENTDNPGRTLVPSKHQLLDSPPCHDAMRAAGATQYQFTNLFLNADLFTASPLPILKWADSDEVWKVLKKKDQQYTRDPHVFRRHPALQTRMRSVLLDWLSEVCEVYRLHRETFHLAIDFFDRYLMTQINLQKQSLQLIGVTALFIAAKIEEIYPPKVAEFAYVTDGACAESDLMQQEIIILKALKWDLNPVTANTWMTVYLQILNNHKSNEETTLTETMFSQHSFIQIARLIDLCHLDIGSLQFSYAVLSASVLYHFSNEQSMLKASGFHWHDVAACVSWMAPFAIEVRESGPVHMRPYEGVERSDYCNIQTHAIDLEMLEGAQRRQQFILDSSRESPKQQQLLIPNNILTPPPTTHKNSSPHYFNLC